MSGFPNVRLRRLRRTGVLRELVRETELRSSDLIYPLFVSETEAGRSAIPSMPGVERLSVAELAREAALAWEEGIRAVLLFGIPAERDETAAIYREKGEARVYSAVAYPQCRYRNSATRS